MILRKIDQLAIFRITSGTLDETNEISGYWFRLVKTGGRSRLPRLAKSIPRSIPNGRVSTTNFSIGSTL